MESEIQEKAILPVVPLSIKYLILIQFDTTF
jgi:hypothetical protein